MSRLGLLCLASACAGPPSADSPVAQGTDSGGDPSPYAGPGDRPAPTLDAALLAAGAQVGVGAIAAIVPHRLYDAVAEANRQGNSSCPAPYPAVGVTDGWSNDCTTASGWSFAGRSQFAWLSNIIVSDARWDQYGEFITNARIGHPSGASLDIEGYGELTERTVDGRFTRDSWLFGSFRHEGDWLAPGWLDGGASLSLRTLGEQTAGRTAVTVEGGLSRDPSLPEGVIGVSARALAVAQDAAACSVQGTLVVLASNGARIELVFDEADPACQACTTDPDGEALCLDLAPLLAAAGP
jgi:hypothetical protein